MQDLLVRHEGLRLSPYQDSLGIWTVAVGRNLQSKGISLEEASESTHLRSLKNLLASDRTYATEAFCTIIKGLTIDHDDAMLLLDHDMCDAMTDVKRLCSIYDELSPARQACLVDMAFNLGYTRFSKFVRFWNAIHKEDFAEAAEEMLASKWAAQVKGRATELARMMKENVL